LPKALKKNIKLCPRLLIHTSEKLVVLELDDNGVYRKTKSISTTTPPPPLVATSEKIKTQVAELIIQLGDKIYKVRESAGKKLLQIGHHAYEPLKQAANESDDIEIQTRAKGLAGSIAETLDETVVRVNNIAVIGDSVYVQHGMTIRKLDSNLRQVASVDFKTILQDSEDVSLTTYANYIGFTADDRGIYLTYEGRIFCYDRDLNPVGKLLFEQRYKHPDGLSDFDWRCDAFSFFLSVHKQVAYVYSNNRMGGSETLKFFIIDLADPAKPMLLPKVANTRGYSSRPWITTNPPRWHVGIRMGNQHRDSPDYITASLEHVTRKDNKDRTVTWPRSDDAFFRNLLADGYRMVVAPDVSPGWAIVMSSAANVLAKYSPEKDEYINICRLDLDISKVLYDNGYLYCLDKATNTLRVIQLGSKPKLIMERTMKSLGYKGLADVLPWPTVKKTK